MGLSYFGVRATLEPSINKANTMRYTKTVTIHNELEFKGLHIGQWFRWHLGSKGQYMGQTKAGTYVCVYSATPFNTAHAKRNKLQRDYAKRYGAK